MATPAPTYSPDVVDRAREWLENNLVADFELDGEAYYNECLLDACRDLAAIDAAADAHDAAMMRP